VGAETTTLSGEVKRVTYENEGTSFRVVKLGGIAGRGEVSIVGTFQAVGPGTQVRVTGKFVQDSKHGEQFRVETLVLVDPTTLAGIERYLGSGIIAGIGPGFAKRVVERFGVETLKVLDENPARLREVRGLGKKRADTLRESWREQRVMGSVMLLLETHGASPSLAPRIIERFGERAAAVVAGAPYRLALDVRGVGFKTADKIARSLGIAGDHPERAQAGVVHTLERLADRGHVACLREELVNAAADMLEIDGPHVDAAIDALWAGGRLVVEGQDVFCRTRNGRAPGAFARESRNDPGRSRSGDLALRT
jgi:exodeoxyribonuclease V alpha subunit